MKNKPTWHADTISMTIPIIKKPITTEGRITLLENEVELIKKDLKENYLKKADLWKGVAVGLVWIAIGFAVFVIGGVLL